MAHLSGDEALIEAFNSALRLPRGHRLVGVPRPGRGGRPRPAPQDQGDELRPGVRAERLRPVQPAHHLHRRGPHADGGVLHQRFGGVRDYLQAVVRRAVQDGYTATILGRRRYLPDLTSDNRQRREMAERMALNAPIQGSAADIIKVAMLRVDARPARGRPALADAAAGPRRAGLRRGAGRARAAGGAGPAGDGRRLPAVRARWRSRSASAATGTAPTTDHLSAAVRAPDRPPRAAAERLVARLPSVSADIRRPRCHRGPR